MKINRTMTIETNEIQIGDRLRVGRYTATCQTVAEKGATFLLDQYLDQTAQMKEKNTNKGGYGRSDLRKYLRSDTVLSDFEEVSAYMKPWNNGDLLRIPYYGEMFGDNNLPSWVNPDGYEQWLQMKDAHNRAASRRGDPEWGWLANTVCENSTDFCGVDTDGGACYGDADARGVGVRPAFLIKLS